MSGIPRSPGGVVISGVYQFLLPEQITMGSIGIRKGMSPGNNPYRGTEVEDRPQRLDEFRRGVLPSIFEVWYMPAEGGALKLAPEDASRVIWGDWKLKA